MLHSSVVPIHRHPVLHIFLACQGFGIMRIGISQKIPGGTGPLRHGVCFPFCLAAAPGTGGIHPIRHVGQRGFPVVRRLIAFHIRQQYRQLRLRNRHPAAFIAVNQWDGLSPIPLTGKYPVAQFIVYLGDTQPFFLQPCNHGLFGFLYLHAVQETGVHQSAVFDIRIGFLPHIPAGHHFHNGKAELLRKFPVPAVMSRDRHNGSGPIRHQDIIGYKDGNLLSIYRVHRQNALNPDPGLFLYQLCPLKIGFPIGSLPISRQLFRICNPILLLPDQRMLRCNHHIGGTKQRVRTGGIDPELAAAGYPEVHLCSGGPPDPVSLLQLHPLYIIHILQSIQKLFRIIGDLQHPLVLYPADHFPAAALAHAIDDLFIGKADLAGSAPVDCCFFLIRQAPFKQLQENPLCPFIVFRIRGIDFPGPVKGKAQRFHLRLKAGNILLRNNLRMNFILYGIVFSGKSKRVPAHGKQDIISLQPSLAGNDIHCGIWTGMSHMKPLPRRIGKFDQCIIFWLRLILRHLKCAFLIPDRLPLFFNYLWMILFHNIFRPLLFLVPNGSLTAHCTADIFTRSPVKKSPRLIPYRDEGPRYHSTCRTLHPAAFNRR